MSESFNITFQGIDGVTGTIDRIKSTIKSLDSSNPPTRPDILSPELIISSSQIESEMQQLFSDVHDQIQRDATTTESDFDGAWDA